MRPLSQGEQVGWTVIIWGLVLGHPCGSPRRPGFVWEPGNRVAGAAAGPGCGQPCSGAVSTLDLKATLPPCSFPFSWPLVWLFVAHLEG